MTGEWRFLRRRGVPGLLRHMVKRHPEIARPCVWDDFVRICERERVVVRVVRLPKGESGRLVRADPHVFIQLSEHLSRAERTVVGFHELAHLWRDDPGVACYYSDHADTSPGEDFCDVFAWAVTSPARQYVKGIREEDF